MKVIAHASDEKGAERVSRLWEPRLACGLPKTIEQLIKLVGREEVGHLTEGGGAPEISEIPPSSLRDIMTEGRAPEIREIPPSSLRDITPRSITAIHRSRDAPRPC